MRLRFLLRPGWLALLLAVIVFAGACFWLLSPWQFRRNAERSAQNGELTTAQLAAPAPIDTVLPGGAAPSAATQWRQVTLSGRYLPAGEAAARLRTVYGEAAFEVVTPFRRDDGQVVLIDRGYVSPDNGRVPAYAAPPAGEVALTARVQPDEPVDPKHPAAFTQDGRRQVYSISAAVLGAASGLTVRPGYYTLVDGQPGVLGALPLPDEDSGPFLSYALQWIAFGVMAIGGLGYFTFRELRPGGALTAEGRAARRAAHPDRVRGRRAVAEAIAAEEAEEARAETVR